MSTKDNLNLQLNLKLKCEYVGERTMDAVHSRLNFVSTRNQKELVQSTLNNQNFYLLRNEIESKPFVLPSGRSPSEISM